MFQLTPRLSSIPLKLARESSIQSSCNRLRVPREPLRRSYTPKQLALRAVDVRESTALKHLAHCVRAERESISLSLATVDYLLLFSLLVCCRPFDAQRRQNVRENSRRAFSHVENLFKENWEQWQRTRFINNESFNSFGMMSVTDFNLILHIRYATGKPSRLAMRISLGKNPWPTSISCVIEPCICESVAVSNCLPVFAGFEKIRSAC